MLHFCIYSWIRTIQMAANKCFYSLVPSRLSKYLWARKGVYGTDAIKEQMNYETVNAKWSPVVLQAGIHMGGLLVIFQFSIAFLLVGSIGRKATEMFYDHIFLFGIFFVIVSGLINYTQLFKKDRYLSDFKDFEKLPKRVIVKCKILSFLSVIGVLASFFACMLWTGRHF